MVNGKWLMRNRQLTVLDEQALLAEAQGYARRIDSFLIKREGSVLSKLVAIGPAEQEESFEVQAKARLADPDPVFAALQKPEIEILRTRHYHEYDTYFVFSEPDQGYLRHREDEFIEEDGSVSGIRYRLTLIGPSREREFPSDVLLSRSRYISPANHSLRFFREYFKPADEIFIEKDRLRWRVLFQGTEFYINLDRVDRPDLGYFVEVKSRTWSRRDADHKAQVATKLMQFLGASPQETVNQDYLELVENR
jgi:5-methylthioadenosine/S-adenosylhomocysteine deaminase